MPGTPAERLATSVAAHARALHVNERFLCELDLLADVLQEPLKVSPEDVVPLLEYSRSKAQVQRVLALVGSIVRSSGMDWTPWFDMKQVARVLESDGATREAGHLLAHEIDRAEARAAGLGGFEHMLEEMATVANTGVEQGVRSALTVVRKNLSAARSGWTNALFAFALKYGLPPDPEFLSLALEDSCDAIVRQRHAHGRGVLSSTIDYPWLDDVHDLFVREDVLPPWTATDFVTFRVVKQPLHFDPQRYGIRRVPRTRHGSPTTQAARAKTAQHGNRIWELVRDGLWDPFAVGRVADALIQFAGANPGAVASPFGTWHVYLIDGSRRLAVREAQARVQRRPLSTYAGAGGAPATLKIVGFELKGSRRTTDKDDDSTRVHTDFVEAHLHVLNRLLEMKRLASAD